MESTYSHNRLLVGNILSKMIEACDLIALWNEPIGSFDDYLCTPDGMQKLAASCMLIESIGEGAKRIEKLLPGFLSENEPTIPWKSVMGIRDHIAHGYFNIDAEIIYDVAINELPQLKESLARLKSLLS